MPGRLSITLVCLVLAAVGCSGLILDRSIPAADAGDLTLAVSACEAVPSRGLDICRVKAGAPIDSSWRLVMPTGKVISGGELKVFYRDVVRTYSIQGSLVEVPWRDVMRQDTWTESLAGTALALAEIRWKDPEGIEQVWRARGEARILVLPEGYAPMPIDSGFQTFGTKCRIQYSTAGRSAVECRP
jgi:hypothetical protein